MREESVLKRFIIKILEKIGLIKTIGISKKKMCKSAQSICNHECNTCAWNEVEE